MEEQSYLDHITKILLFPRPIPYRDLAEIVKPNKGVELNKLPNILQDTFTTFTYKNHFELLLQLIHLNCVNLLPNCQFNKSNIGFADFENYVTPKLMFLNISAINNHLQIGINENIATNKGAEIIYYVKMSTLQIAQISTAVFIDASTIINKPLLAIEID